MLTRVITRRDTLRSGLTAAGLLAFLPDWPALAEGDTDVPFRRLSGRLQSECQSQSGKSLPRYPRHRWPHHAQRSVLLHPALQSSRDRRRCLPPQVHWHGE